MSEGSEPRSDGYAFQRYVSERIGGPVRSEAFTEHKFGSRGNIMNLVNYRKTYEDYFDRLVHCRLLSKAVTASGIQRAILADVTSTIRTFEDIIENENEYRLYFESSHEHSQALLDLLHELLVLQCPAVHVPRATFTKALCRLSDTSGLHPKCLEIPTVIRLSNNAISGGSFADVWKGIVNQQLVALKVIRVFKDQEKKEMIKHFREAFIWSQFRHPNVLPFFGLYLFEERICFVSPWMDNGDLEEHINRHPSANRIRLAHDIAHAVEFLHSKKIVHGDLKGNNILITPFGRACIADFGLSHVIKSQANKWPSLRSTTMMGGTVRWQAPELFQGQTNTFASDVYAVGSVFYEIFTGHHPFVKYQNDAHVMLQVLKGDRPERPSECSDPMWQLMQMCWLSEAGLRPDMPTIVRSIHSQGENDCPAPEWENAGDEVGRALRKYPLIPCLPEIDSIFSHYRSSSMLDESLRLNYEDHGLSKTGLVTPPSTPYTITSPQYATQESSYMSFSSQGEGDLRTFRCYICRKEGFTSEMDLHGHIRSHGNLRIFSQTKRKLEAILDSGSPLENELRAGSPDVPRHLDFGWRST